jgi:hypothetical protein
MFIDPLAGVQVSANASHSAMIALRLARMNCERRILGTYQVSILLQPERTLKGIQWQSTEIIQRRATQCGSIKDN